MDLCGDSVIFHAFNIDDVDVDADVFVPDHKRQE